MISLEYAFCEVESYVYQPEGVLLVAQSSPRLTCSCQCVDL